MDKNLIKKDTKITLLRHIKTNIRYYLLVLTCLSIKTVSGYSGYIVNNSTKHIQGQLFYEFFFIDPKPITNTFFQLKPGEKFHYTTDYHWLISVDIEENNGIGRKTIARTAPQGGGSWVFFDNPYSQNQIDWVHEF